jgi:hypothetical protein
LRGKDGGDGIGVHGGGACLTHHWRILRLIEEMAQGEMANGRIIFF